MYPSSIGSSAGHSMSIWNQWSITDSVRTPMASAVWANDGEGRPDGLGTTGPREARHMDIELHVVLRIAPGEGTAARHGGTLPGAEPVLSART